MTAAQELHVIERITALESELAAERARLDWLEANARRVAHSTGYGGSPDVWMWRDDTPEKESHDAPSLRAAIDEAMKGTV